MKPQTVLPPIGEFLKTSAQLAEHCGTLLSIRSRTIRVPVNVKHQARAIIAFNRYWATKKSAYTLLQDELQQMNETPTRTARGGSRGAAA